MECMTDDCGKEMKSRGLCFSCYKRAEKMVKAGEVTWEQLEELGLCTPPQRIRAEGGHPFDKALRAKLKMA